MKRRETYEDRVERWRSMGKGYTSGLAAERQEVRTTEFIMRDVAQESYRRDCGLLTVAEALAARPDLPPLLALAADHRTIAQVLAEQGGQAGDQSPPQSGRGNGAST